MTIEMTMKGNESYHTACSTPDIFSLAVFLSQLRYNTWYYSLKNDGVPFIVDVLALILNAPNCRLVNSVGFTASLYDLPTLFPLES